MLFEVMHNIEPGSMEVIPKPNPLKTKSSNIRILKTNQTLTSSSYLVPFPSLTSDVCHYTQLKQSFYQLTNLATIRSNQLKKHTKPFAIEAR